MVKIKIKAGGCGIKYTDAKGNTRHAFKMPKDGPFECDDAQASRLVGLGVAEYVSEKAAEPAPQSEAQEGTGKLTGHLDAEELGKWDYNNLKKLAADMGVHPASQKKADLIAAIVAEEVEVDEADAVEIDEDGDDLPDLSAADPE